MDSGATDQALRRPKPKSLEHQSVGSLIVTCGQPPGDSLGQDLTTTLDGASPLLGIEDVTDTGNGADQLTGRIMKLLPQAMDVGM